MPKHSNRFRRPRTLTLPASRPQVFIFLTIFITLLFMAFQSLRAEERFRPHQEIQLTAQNGGSVEIFRIFEKKRAGRHEAAQVPSHLRYQHPTTQARILESIPRLGPDSGSSRAPSRAPSKIPTSPKK